MKFVLTMLVMQYFMAAAQGLSSIGYCWHPDGLYAYQEQDITSDNYIIIPANAEVKILSKYTDQQLIQTHNPEDYIELNLTGNWVKIEFNGFIGYAFDGYVSRIKPQSFDDYFKGLTPNISETIKTNIYTRIETYNRHDGSTYVLEIADGCYTDKYTLKNINFNEMLMMLYYSFKHDPEYCPFELSKINNNEFHFKDCEASLDRIIIVESNTITFSTYNCD